MTTPTSCPVCNGTSFSHHLDVKDYTVSQETFRLAKCTQCQFLITTPIPENLSRYYESPEYISHTNKANSLTDHLYKIARVRTLRWKTNIIKEHSANGTDTLLDYGCGTGSFLAQAKKNGWTVDGVEPADAPRQLASRENHLTIVKTIDQLPDKKFRAITLWHVLEHIPNLNETLNQLASRLQDNGTIFIAVPNHNSYDAKHYKKYWAAYDVPRHLWHFSQQNMKQLLQTHQLKVDTIIPMKLDALYVSILSEKYKHNKTSMLSLPLGLMKGMQSNLSAARNHEYSSLIYIARK